VSAVMYIYMGAQTVVRTVRGNSDNVEVKVGMHQGSALSLLLFMAALRSRCGHYILSCFYLSFFFSSPNLSGRRLDVYHPSTHGVALVQI